ncbi:MAG: hypothetical protein DPW18_15735 [Chloroflexi bacterium]|nr:hypothetical protein [Chloroflexota bacterium]MDL1944522.1 hypothetical protein [Chloroflexi bacterium CFX2]
MKKIPFLILISALLISACASFAPEPTAAPTQTATPIPAATEPPTSTPTAIPPTATEVLEVPLPVGTPLEEWNGIPIMPGAIAGEEEDDAYRFTTAATIEEIKAYYEFELIKLGWNLMATGTDENGGTMLMFIKESMAVMPISIISRDDVNLVLIVKP